jgi:hypothetical protein
MPFVFLASLLTWALIERPFRNTKAISRQSLIAFASGSAIFFILVGLYLNATYGIPERAFGKDVKTGEMDKRVYNERVFSFKNDAFQSISKIKVLVVGNSFARDFVNITLETFDVTGVEIIYRDDLGQCIDHPQSPSASPLFFSADVVVFGSGSYRDCYQSDLELLSRNGKQVFYVGTKNFGYNLNWLIHVDPSARANRYNRISEQVLAYDQRMSLSIPNDNFISLIKPVILNGQIPITDHKGRMLTTDRQHLTRYGAIYFGQKSVRGSRYSEIFAQSPARRQ